MKNGGKTFKQNPNNGGNNQKSNSLAPINHSKMKKNKTRLGGGGLSLQAFANAKSKNDGYNPALIKKQREFYKNAKYVSKYKKSQKQMNPGQSSSQATKLEGTSEDREVGEKHPRKPKKAYRLEEIYRQKQEEEEKARMEKEAIIKSKKEAKEKAEARRKSQKEKMLKRTRSGQPVMKYRIEHLLQTLQGSNGSQ